MAVYCKNCIYYVSGEKIPVDYGPPVHIKEDCLAPENLADTHKDSRQRQRSIPKIINRFNNCPWYTEEADVDNGDSSSGDSSGGSSGDSSGD